MESSSKFPLIMSLYCSRSSKRNQARFFDPGTPIKAKHPAPSDTSSAPEASKNAPKPRRRSLQFWIPQESAFVSLGSLWDSWMDTRAAPWMEPANPARRQVCQVAQIHVVLVILPDLTRLQGWTAFVSLKKINMYTVHACDMCA